MVGTSPSRVALERSGYAEGRPLCRPNRTVSAHSPSHLHRPSLRTAGDGAGPGFLGGDRGLGVGAGRFRRQAPAGGAVAIERAGRGLLEVTSQMCPRSFPACGEESYYTSHAFMAGPAPRILRTLLTAVVLVTMTAAGTTAQTAGQTFRWAGDPEGGAPYVEASPDNPDELVGFDVEIADLLARGLGRTPQFVFVTLHFDHPVHRPRRRGDRPERHRGHARPAGDDGGHAAVLRVPRGARGSRRRCRAVPHARRTSPADASATLGGTIAYEILLRAEREYGLTAVSYEDDVHPYRIWCIGRVDAVLLDNVLAFGAARTVEGIHGSAAERRHRALRRRAVAGERVTARSRATRSSRRRCATARSSGSSASGRSGTTISRRSTPACWLANRSRRSWGSTPATRRTASRGWDAAQALSAVAAAGVGRHASCSRACRWRLAVALGVVIASGRVYGERHRARCCSPATSSSIRGTPILLQLFVLYYGIAAAIRLPAFVAAFLGLALNYAAYESEIYRSALEAYRPRPARGRAHARLHASGRCCG